MRTLRAITAVLLSTMLIVAFTACKSKQEKPQAGAPMAEKSAPPAPLTDKDRTDAKAAAARVQDQMKKGEFAKIYAEAEAGFRKIGTEAQFVAAMQKTRLKAGEIKSIKQVSHESGPNGTQVLLFHVQYDNVPSEQRLTFSRAGDGRMELFGFNQRDLKK